VQNDSISVALGLPRLKILEQQELEDRFEVTVMYRQGDGTCPGCGRLTIKERGQRLQWKQRRRLRNKAVFLRLIKRRFRCFGCGKVGIAS